jgi:hypothetical protein
MSDPRWSEWPRFGLASSRRCGCGQTYFLPPISTGPYSTIMAAPFAGSTGFRFGSRIHPSSASIVIRRIAPVPGINRQFSEVSGRRQKGPPTHKAAVGNVVVRVLGANDVVKAMLRTRIALLDSTLFSRCQTSLFSERQCKVRLT